MKKDLSVTILFGLIVIIIIFMLYAMDSHQQQIDQLKQPQVTEVVRVEPVKTDAALVEKLEELAKEVQQLEWENAALRDEVKNFGGWWKDWKGKNDIGVEVK